VGAPSGANLGDRFLTAAATAPDRDAVVVHGPEPRRLTYAELVDRVWRAAAVLHGRGVRPGDRVGVLLANGNEHLEILLASFLLRAAPVNLGLRDTQDERRVQVGAARCHLVVREPDTDLAGVPSLVRGDQYESALASARTRPDVEGRSGDDEYVLATGGTTGAPKLVRWRHDDLYRGALAAAGEEVTSRRAVSCLPASPFTHGTGQWMALTTLLHGGTVVCRGDRRLDATALLDAVDDERASFLAIVGDPFAIPILDALGDRTLPSLTTILSGGAVLSPDAKRALLEWLPTVMIVDGFGASETGGHGRMISVAGAVIDGPPRFAFDEQTTVVDVDDDGVGWLARRGPIPLGYEGVDHSESFPVVDGERVALSGDRARVEDDGTVTVLGREASTITTGGHKVHAEEVEGCVLTHPAVRDAVVVGVPDPRFGQRIAAVVSGRHDARPTLESVRRHCRRVLAPHKLPRLLVVVDEVHRSAAGKPDYAWARTVAST
jgi:acyl-CoA synthetase (AMP-forming)/AMP-acid ligase II